MKIENLTNNSVPLKSSIRTVNGIRDFTRMISPRGKTYIEDESTYPDLMRLYEAGVLAINGKTYDQTKDEHAEETPEVADSTPVSEVSEDPKGEGTVADSTETAIPKVPEDASEFTCPHCHAEFASSRGLGLHIKKSHPEVSE